MNEHRKRGQLDALAGRPASYGCHFGMRSTLEACRAEYHAGYEEVTHALAYGSGQQISVSADHIVPRHSCQDASVQPHYDRYDGTYSVSIAQYGCSKGYSSIERAIRGMLAEHACTNVRISWGA